MQWQFIVLLKSPARGYIAITEVTQDRNNNHFHLLMYRHYFMQLTLKQIDTCLSAHMHAQRLIAHTVTRTQTVADGPAALCIVICLGACTGISSSFQWLHSWPSQSPRGRRQLCGGAVWRTVSCVCVCVFVCVEGRGGGGARHILI